jgi:excisionase family DNA binding protein
VIDDKFTTAEAAKRAGIHQVTLQKWIAAGRLTAPKATLIGAVGYRLWSAKDVALLLKIKEASYRKGRGRKKKSGNR